MHHPQHYLIRLILVISRSGLVSEAGTASDRENILLKTQNGICNNETVNCGSSVVIT